MVELLNLPEKTLILPRSGYYAILKIIFACHL
jgi:hypothetical protein